MSAEAVLRRFLDDELLIAPALAIGPMVWGVAPRSPGTGLGAMALATRHAGKVGRPRGGSGALTEALAAAVRAGGGRISTGVAVRAVDCDGQAVRGVTFADGNQLRAPVVVSATDPRRTFVDWLSSPPASAARAIRRWRSVEGADGYESKVDAVLEPGAGRARRGRRHRFQRRDRAHLGRHRSGRDDARPRSGARPAGTLPQHPVGDRPDTRARRPPCVQPRVPLHAVPLRTGMGRSRRAAPLAGPRRRRVRGGVRRVGARLARRDTGRLRAGVPPPLRPRRQLCRWSTGRLAQHAPRADEVRDQRRRALPHRAQQPFPAPASGVPAGAIVPR